MYRPALEGGRCSALSLLCGVSTWSLCLDCGARGRDKEGGPSHQPCPNSCPQFLLINWWGWGGKNGASPLFLRSHCLSW